jgi:hypothetical protein
VGSAVLQAPRPRGKTPGIKGVSNAECHRSPASRQVRPQAAPPRAGHRLLRRGASRQDVIDNAAVLSITDRVTGEEKAYWTQAIFEGDGGERCLGFRLTAFASGEVVDLPRDLSSCDCPDRTYKRPGGCRHMAALRQALPTVTGTVPSTSTVAK